MKKICVLGGGSWGATIASLVSNNAGGKAEVSLWEFVDARAREMRETRRLSILPQLRIPDPIDVGSDIGRALRGADGILSIVPSEFVRSTWKAARPHVSGPELVVSFSKGIERGSLKRMSEVIAEECPAAAGKIAVVSGPSHAEEVAQSIPTAVVAASERKSRAGLAQELLASPSFRVYTNSDVVGAEICGALKNIFAIACGACDGLGLGDNTKSALITRGLSEMAKLGVALGGSQPTFYGLAGMGDLVVTCFSRHSRNRLFGEKIGKGGTPEEALKEMTMVAEGYPTSLSAQSLVEKTGSNCPIITEIHSVLYRGKNIRDSISDLMTRPTHEETRQVNWKDPS